MRRPRGRSRLRTAACLCALACTAPALVACSSASEPSRTQYDLTFPSTAAAVAVDAVEVHVFDASQIEGDVCASLVVRRRIGPDLPASLVSRSDLTPCALEAGEGTLDVSFGPRAFLVVAQRARQDLLIGCAYVDLDAGSAPVSIPLTLFSTTVAVPATACARLSDHCSGGC